jgi:hypothetical protein
MAAKLKIEKRGDEILMGLSDTILKGTHPCQGWFNLVQRFQRRRSKCDLLSKYA